MSENSENHAPDQVLESSGSPEHGNEGFDGTEHGNEAMERSDESTATPDPEFSSGDANIADSVRGNPDDGNLTEDAGKEDMFVDAPDQLTVYDGRNAGIGESMAIIEPQESSVKMLDIQESPVQMVDDGGEVNRLMGELSHVQALLDKLVGEKETLEHNYEEERELFARELANLHHQLEDLTNQHSFLDENDTGFVDRLHRAEIGDRGEMSEVSVAPLQVMIGNCSKFTLLLRKVLDERAQTEGTMREIHAILFTKDQEIEDLHAKVTELSVSRDVVVSYLESLQNIWSHSLKQLSEVQLEKDQHVEGITNRILASLAMVIQQEDLLDDSVNEKISHVEKGTILMIENYNRFLSEIDQLKQCLTEVKSDFRIPEETEFGAVFGMARDELLESKRKELDMVEELNKFESENRILLEQLKKERERFEAANAEAGKTKTELEQEKFKFATTKEKLSMAVTKGKALVQQRDSLKQSLAEKTSELEKCLLELQEKSNALEASEISVEELVKCQNLAASLQESLSQRDMVLKEIQEALSLNDTPEGLQSLDITERIRWLVDQRNIFEGISLEFQKLKDALSTIDLPETISYSDVESQINWLGESFSQAKNDILKLQEELANTQGIIAVGESELLETHNEIGRLTASLSAEKREKDSLQMGLEDLTRKYEGSVEKAYRISSEKDQMMRMFQVASGIIVDDQGGINQPSSDMAIFIEKCVGKIREQVSASFEYSCVEAEQFEIMQSLLYVRDQELMLCEKILEEELDRSEVTNLSNELIRASQDIAALKDERDSLQKDLERFEEKYSLIREKLSTAVKKGKGLVQEREGLKHSLHEKKTEIERLNLELQRQESAVSECRDQIDRLSSDLEHIPKLESDLIAMKDERDQLEQFLVESNNMLQRVIESIEGIALPVDAVFEEPVDKMKWLAKYYHECQVDKTHAEQELEKVKEEARSLASKLAEADITVKSLEDALSQTEQNIFLLSEEKKDIEVGKIHVEQELERAREEANSHVCKFAEVCATIKSLEDALLMAEKNKVSVEIELEKAKEEAGFQASKLAEAYISIKSLEDALSQVEKNVAVLSEEKNDAQHGKACLEKELEKVKEEAVSQASKQADAYATIKSLEDALSQAEKKNSVIDDEKKMTEQEIVALNAKLAACMEELSGTHGSFESWSVGLLGQLNHLQMLMKDESLLYLVTKGFKRKFESLGDMDLLLKDIRDQLVDKGLERPHVPPGTERDSYVAKLSSADFDNMPNGTMDNSEMREADLENVFSYLAKMVEGFNKKNKLLEEKFEGFSSSLDELIAFLITALQATRDEVIVMLENADSLKKTVMDLEASKQSQESMISTLENDIKTLLSACTDATRELQFELDNSLLDLSSLPEPEKLNHSLYLGAREAGGDAVQEQQERVDGTEFVNVTQNLLLATRKIQNQTKQFGNIKSVLLMTIEDLQNRLKETKLASENSVQERDMNCNKIFKLENDLEALQIDYREMRLKLEDYQAKENKLREKEEELSSKYSTLAMRGQEADGYLLSEGQRKSLIEKINGIEIPFKELELENLVLHSSSPVEKLFYIIDSVTELQHQMNLFSHEKEELQLSLEAQACEIENLKKEAESLLRNNQDSEKMRTDLADVVLGLEKFIQNLGGNDLVEYKKSIGVRGLLQVLEKLVMARILESESSKSEAQELGAKLLGSEKVVDELSTKVKLLEDATHGRPALSDTVQERSILEEPSLATGSEISEIEDVGPLGKKSTSPAPYAAHVRTMRKGSSDHLALSIDMESDRLINHETDEDKGHVFKSLNTTGIVPKQGKMIADRIDGIWVSGNRVLMSRPGARIGLIAYCLLLHLWVLGTIL